MSFASGIAGYAKRTGLSIDNAVIAVCTEASVNIIKKTPVDTGRARGAWFASINDISSEVSETRSENEAIISAIMTAQKASGVIFTLTNNLPYIRGLEYGRSKQSPAGMVRLTVEEISTSLKAFK